MKRCQSTLLVCLGLGTTIAALLLTSLTSTPSAPPNAPTPSPSPITSPSPSLPSSRLDPNRVKQALDRGDLAGAIMQVEVGWKQQFEDYYQGKLTSKLVNPDGIAHTLNRLAYLTKQKSASVYMLPSPQALELMVVTPNGKLIHKRIPAANRDVLLKTIRSFRMGLVNPVAESIRDYKPAAQQLYQWMIAPLESELKAQNINTLIFCLGNGLRSLPMAALHDGRQFLVEKYSLAIIPAFNLLDSHPGVLQGTQVLAMGASEFQAQEPLPAVPLELSVIAGKLWRGKSLLNQDFTLANLKAQRSQYPFGIVHLATHAEFTAGSVQDSYIQFSDGRLRLNQFRELGLRVPVVQLLVLSACQTALGDPQAELGFAGLAVQSGSKTAIASLWSVSDAGTLVLMSELYRYLRSAPTKADALRQAQIAMLRGHATLTSNPTIRAASQTLPPELVQFRNTELAHPFYWASFTLIGNPW